MYLQSSDTSVVTIFIGLNFSEWRKQVHFHLTVLDLDLAVDTIGEKSGDIIGRSSEVEKLKHKAWDHT